MKYSVSIISHHSGEMIANLFGDLRHHLPSDAEVILTINVPEDESYLQAAQDLPLKVIRNTEPLGFGTNHNQAFAVSRGERFVVVNPDIRLPNSPWSALDDAFGADIGACAPLVLSPAGQLEDSARKYPTLLRFFRRVFLGQRQADYQVPRDTETLDVEWVGGMFVMFDAAAYRAIGGFDTRYFMYLEDADICRRLNANGKKVRWVSNCRVIHDARRASRKNLKHLRWHITSALKFLSTSDSESATQR